MAAFNTTHPATGSLGLAGRIGFTLASMTGAFSSWNDARVTRNALSGLTDRQLEDIGLVRGDIDIVAETRRLG